MADLRKKRLQKFTIVEILVAMSVFAILMLIIMQIFGSLQNVWTTTSKRTETSQNANMIMNMIAADLQSAYYSVEAPSDSSWCYYQRNVELTGDDSPVWFVTSRRKSVQTSSTSLVQTGYWVEEVVRDNLPMYVLKNLTISNVKYDGVSDTSLLYNHKTTAFPDAKLRTIHSDLKTVSVIVDDNIISLKITPYMRKIDPDTGKGNLVSPGESGWDSSKDPYRLPAYVKIELQMLDDDPAVREEYKDASAEERKRMVRTFTRVIEINRGQHYR